MIIFYFAVCRYWEIIFRCFLIILRSANEIYFYSPNFKFIIKQRLKEGNIPIIVFLLNAIKKKKHIKKFQQINRFFLKLLVYFLEVSSLYAVLHTGLLKNPVQRAGWGHVWTKHSSLVTWWEQPLFHMTWGGEVGLMLELWWPQDKGAHTLTSATHSTASQWLGRSSKEGTL